MIDTGVWPENPMFSPTGVSAPAGGLKGCQFGDGSDAAHLGAPFACNNKLIGAYAFMSTYMANVGTDGQEFCNNANGSVLRLATPRVTARTPRRPPRATVSPRPCSTASTAARSAGSRRAPT